MGDCWTHGVGGKGGKGMNPMMQMMQMMMGMKGGKGSGKGGSGNQKRNGIKEGDWACPSCGDHQFARNEKCRKCETPKPDVITPPEKKCKWCEQGQCWDHGQIEKPKSAPY